MGFNRDEDINPSAENLAAELFYILKQLFSNESLNLVNLRLYETPNCWVDAQVYDYVMDDKGLNSLRDWRREKGEMTYDIREEI